LQHLIGLKCLDSFNLADGGVAKSKWLQKGEHIEAGSLADSIKR
jgi:hypothetical protein